VVISCLSGHRSIPAEVDKYLHIILT